jgi:hypothetical protein
VGSKIANQVLQKWVRRSEAAQSPIATIISRFCSKTTIRLAMARAKGLTFPVKTPTKHCLRGEETNQRAKISLLKSMERYKTKAKG